MVARQGAIAIFVKTPGFSPLKTRLAQSIGQTQAEQFHTLSAKAVEAVVRYVSEREPVVPYWAVAEEPALSSPIWKQFSTVFQGTGDLGMRLAHIDQCLFDAHDYIIFLGADSPQLPVSYLLEAIELLSKKTDQPQFVIGPAIDGGFYLFGSQVSLTQKEWLNIPYSASNTTEKLLEQIQRRGKIHKLPLLTDVDTINELQMIEQQVEIDNNLLLEQHQVLEWIRSRDSFDS